MRVIASQKLPRDSGESIFAARHQDASQGPLGKGPKIEKNSRSPSGIEIFNRD